MPPKPRKITRHSSVDERTSPSSTTDASVQSDKRVAPPRSRSGGQQSGTQESASDPPFNFSVPDYKEAFLERIRRLKKIKEDPARWVPSLKTYYKDHIADFINDWGTTLDQRNAGNDDVPAYLPFILFPRQREWIEWFLERLWANESGACEKSRDMGVSWLAIAVTSSLCLFYEDMTFGFGSRKEEYVDKLDDPKCLFWKARQFINNLPPEFTGTWRLDKHTPHMRLIFPDTRSFISGESGDNIGRGDRTRAYIVDEAAYLERPQLIEASLSETTRCRIDVSSANGIANPFYDKRRKWEGTRRLFTFHWRQDPRKGDEWYAKRCEELDSVIVAQEIDIDYTASVEGILIPSAWVQAAIDAHVKLGWPEVTGAARAGLDVADEGKDKNAFVGGRGNVVEHARQWSGKTIDIYQTTANAFGFCDDYGYSTLAYDSDGVGSGVRGDGRAINEKRERKIELIAYRGSEGVEHPKREDEPGRLNEDFFRNRKAQTGWRLRKRFERTWKAVTKGIKYEPHELISISSTCELLSLITSQLTQPTFTRSDTGHIVIDKLADGVKSPDLYDALAIWEENTGSASAEFFKAGDLLLNTVPLPAPAHYDTVYAVVHTAGKPGKDNIGTAATYWASPLEGPLVLLGWDLTEVEGTMLDGWMPSVFTRLENYSAKARLGSAGIFMSDEGQNPVIAEKASRYGEVNSITGRIVEADARGQMISVSTYVANGMVRLSAEAVDSETEFRGARRNHLMTQVRGASADSKDLEEMAMLRSFVYGVSIALEDEGG